MGTAVWRNEARHETDRARGDAKREGDGEQYSLAFSTCSLVTKRFSRKKAHNRFARKSEDRERFPKKRKFVSSGLIYLSPSPPPSSLALLFLCLAWRPRTAVSGRDFTVQSAGRSLQATLDRLDRKSTGLVPRMSTRRATVQPRACRERDEVIP